MRILVISILIFQVGLSPAVFAASSNTAPSSASNELNSLLGSLDLDPRLEFLENLPSEPTPLDLSINDPLMDADPFFLRNQSWQESPESSAEDDATFSRTENRIEIQLPGSKRIWTLNEPLHPILKTDEYLFLSANPGTDLFEKKGGGEGIFIVSYLKLMEGKSAVPVFFFPLPGKGWQATEQKDLVASEVPDHDLVLLSGVEGQELPLSLHDIRSVVKVENLNLLFSTSQSVEAALKRIKQNQSATQIGERLKSTLTQLSKESNSSGQISEKTRDALAETYEQAQHLLMSSDLDPAPASTAGFGILYTGFDRRNPQAGSTLFASASPSFLEQMVALVSVKEAQADSLHFILDKTARALTICGIVLISGVVSRYTVLRKTIDDRIAGKKGIMPELTAQVDIFAHAMKMIIQIPTLSANALEIMLDQVGVPENSSVRQIFNATFGFVRKSNKGTAVNAKTLLYGGVILGGEDTVLVGLQNSYILKWQGELMGALIPASESRVETAYPTETGQTSPEASEKLSEYRSLNLVQNGIASLTSGASALSQRIQGVKTVEAERLARQQMIAEGIDPEKNPDELEKREDAYVNAALKKQGFPGREDYLFGADVLWQKIMDVFGYSPPKGGSSDDYLGTKRPGLMGRALDRAVLAAKKQVQENPSALNQETLKILKDKQANFTVIRSFMTNTPIFLSPSGILTAAKALRDIRLDMVSLTAIEGGASAEIISIPAFWGEGSSEQARQNSAQLFRSEYFSLTDASGGPTLLDKIQDLAGNPFHKMNQTFEKWQLQRAMTRSYEKLTSEGLDPSALFSTTDLPINTATSNRFKEIFKQELLLKSGLHPDYSDSTLITKVDAEVATQLQQKIANDKDLAKQLGSLSKHDQLLKMTQVESDLFAAVYVQNTVQDDQAPALSPAQPGVFQKIRQTSMIRGNKTANILIRSAEALFSNNRYQRGIWPKLARNIPMLSDVADSAILAGKTFIVTATVSYTWSSSIWHSALPFEAWMVNWMIGIPFVSAPWKTSDRIASNLGLKVNDTIGAMAQYGIFGSMMTMEGMYVYSMFGGDIRGLLDKVIFNPVHTMISAIASIPPHELMAAGAVAAATVTTVAVKKAVELHQQNRATQLAIERGGCGALFESIQ